VIERSFQLYRRTADSRSALALVLANLVPLVGVVFFGWSLWTILVLYWIENGIVGVWNIPRMLLARGSILAGLGSQFGFARRVGVELMSEPAGLRSELAAGAPADESSGAGLPLGARAGLAAFFVIHYGIFWLGHGFFVLLLPTFLGMRASIDAMPAIDPETGLPMLGVVGGTNAFGTIVWSSVAIGAVALFLSHGVSFVVNYVGQREYLRRSAISQMAAPYGRVVVLHLTILFGGFAIVLFGAPVFALVVLVILKTALDLRLHLREHEPSLLAAAAAPA
jgi:Family of unknown function (DUF6498)